MRGSADGERQYDMQQYEILHLKRLAIEE